MQAKNVLYAAVGAPIVAARKVSDQVGTWKSKVGEETAGYTQAAEKALNNWAAEGEKVVSRVSEGAVVEEISSKMDLDQAKEQVGKLRHQLEDMLATWRTSFRPEGKADVGANGGMTATSSGSDAKTGTIKKPAAKTSTAKKPAAKATGAKKPAAKTTGAKKPAAKTSTAKKPAAKKTTTK